MTAYFVCQFEDVYSPAERFAAEMAGKPLETWWALEVDVERAQDERLSSLGKVAARRLEQLRNWLGM